MILTELEIQQAIEQAKVAFPHFTDWEYNNEANPKYLGFSLWGEFVFNPSELIPKRFYITLDTEREEWYSCLTIGQPSYLWSSTDVGDAHLLSAGPCDSLEDAIAY
ncbi:MAG: hypothetical protein GDA48_16905 [Hormoscilla sp. GM102CHS1]|nr:hypothetical protein [Hormoscilla sp. GM102CHS1]